jgi:hypothetical protein
LGATLYRAANVRNPGHNVNSSGSDRLLQSDPILGRNAQIAVTTDRRMDRTFVLQFEDLGGDNQRIAELSFNDD